MRTFIAVKPPAHILAAMTRAAAPLQKAISGGVKWVPAEQIHLTLKFLGEFSAAHVDPLREKLAAECGRIGAIETATTSIGAFPPRGNPRVIWFGIEASAALTRLARMIEDTCADLDYPREKRPFTPHFTIGRVQRYAGNSEVQSIRQALQVFPDPPSDNFRLDRLHFIESTLSPAGPQYRDVFTIAL
jgi:2'-5' RNA ligase